MLLSDLENAKSGAIAALEAAWLAAHPEDVFAPRRRRGVKEEGERAEFLRTCAAIRKLFAERAKLGDVIGILELGAESWLGASHKVVACNGDAKAASRHWGSEEECRQFLGRVVAEAEQDGSLVSAHLEGKWAAIRNGFGGVTHLTVVPTSESAAAE